ncbi:MAG: DNA-binding protein [Candidatus Micrarchaeaceae archaeon]
MQEASTENNENDAAQKAIQKRLRAMQLEEQKKQIIRKILEPGAYERLMNIRVANPELYSQLLDLLIAMAQSNKISDRISEENFKKLLQQIISRPESSIQIKHK